MQKSDRALGDAPVSRREELLWVKGGYSVRGWARPVYLQLRKNGRPAKLSTNVKS